MKSKLIFLTLLLALFLTGCYSFDSNSLYALPQRSQEYRDLQHAVEAALGNGSYSAPVSPPTARPSSRWIWTGTGRMRSWSFAKWTANVP